jgi:hypothetical protein
MAEKSVTLGLGPYLDAEILMKDLASWLGEPEAGPPLGPLETAEQWQGWWERGGRDYHARATRLFELLAETRVAAGVDPIVD